MPDSPDTPGPRQGDTAVMRWAGPLLVGLVGVGMLIRSWRMWPDVLVDFGQQLYLAWQMSEGRTLYADLICNYGPLAPYTNAWVFEFFGASVMSLVAWNLLVFCGIAFFTYRLLLRIGTPFSAASSGVFLMAVFAFSQLSQTGNYNYATPYENSLTVGLLPALAALWLTLRFLAGGSEPALRGAGVCLGLAFLSKPEVFLAGAAGVSASWIAAASIERWDRPRVVRVVTALAMGSALPILICVLALWTTMDLGTAWTGTLGSWPALFGSRASGLLFYQAGMGFDDLGGNLGGVMKTGGLWLLAGLAALASGMGVARLPRAARIPAAGVATAGVALAGVLALDVLDWHKAARPLQLLMLGIAGVALRHLCKLRRAATPDPDSLHRQLARLGYASFAGVLLLKMLLHVRVYHYGFVLAMPAAMLASTALLAWLPQWTRRRGGHGLTTAGVSLALLFAFGQAMWGVSRYEFRLKKTAVGTGPDRIQADDRAHFVNPTLALLERLRPQTMAVFPEGSILNFLARCPNPTPYYNFMPTGYAIFGEDEILSALRATPPEVLVLVEKDTSEFGFRYFGTDYARATRQWIDTHYVRRELFGNRPLRDQRFGIEVLQRRR